MTDPTELRALAQAFVDAWNARDLEAFGRLFHPEFQWHVAVTEPGNPVPRPFHSEQLAGVSFWQPIRDKTETLAAFGELFRTIPQFGVEAYSFTAEGDRVVVEAVGDAVNPANGRSYKNLYCYMFHVRDGQIVLFREYQDELLVYDVWVADGLPQATSEPSQ